MVDENGLGILLQAHKKSFLKVVPKKVTLGIAGLSIDYGCLL